MESERVRREDVAFFEAVRQVRLLPSQRAEEVRRGLEQAQAAHAETLARRKREAMRQPYDRAVQALPEQLKLRAPASARPGVPLYKLQIWRITDLVVRTSVAGAVLIIPIILITSSSGWSNFGTLAAGVAVLALLSAAAWVALRAYERIAAWWRADVDHVTVESDVMAYLAEHSLRKDQH